jgi:nucleoside-diphosphate-sugar epimerase
MIKVLITGAENFIGFYLTELLLEKGYKSKVGSTG